MGVDVTCRSCDNTNTFRSTGIFSIKCISCPPQVFLYSYSILVNFLICTRYSGGRLPLRRHVQPFPVFPHAFISEKQSFGPFPQLPPPNPSTFRTGEAPSSRNQSGCHSNTTLSRSSLNNSPLMFAISPIVLGESRDAGDGATLRRSGES